MDNNDVELTVSRSRRDTDEVFAADEFRHDSFDDSVYKPVARRQNRFFLLGVTCFVLVFGAAFGAKILLLQGHDAALDSGNVDEDGTVINNADNAKVSEAIQNGQIKPGKTKPHSSSSWSGNNGGGEDNKGTSPTSKPTPETGPPEPEPTENPHEDEGHEEPETQRDFKAWHDVVVSTNSGVMYEVLEVLQHDPISFTEGLTYYDGNLYESVGLKKQSQVLVLDQDTGATVKRIPMPGHLFGEGLTYYNGKLIQLTYKAKQGFVYDVENLDAEPETFHYETTTGEGWGLTFDPNRNELIVSDGSPYLHFWNPDTLKPIRKHQIMRLDGTPAQRINELEYWRNRVVANVWYQDVLLIINPETGLVEKEYDFGDIWNQAGATRNNKAEVFNGISISSDPDVLYVTGKWWSNLFKIRLLPEVPEVPK